jgi:hypothetical protein
MNYITPDYFNPKNTSSDPKIRALFDTFPEEFRTNTTFHQYIGTKWFGMSGTDNPSQETFFYYVDTKEPGRLYKVPISIWYNGDSDDFWCRIKYIRYRDMLRIIISDFSGIRLFDEKLNHIFTMELTLEMIESNDVYGYHFDGENILIWKVSSMVELSSSPHGETKDKYHDISRVKDVTTIMNPF